MAVSLEARCPLLDYEVFECLAFADGSKASEWLRQMDSEATGVSFGSARIARQAQGRIRRSNTGLAAWTAPRLGG